MADEPTEPDLRITEIEARVNDTLNGPGRAEHETGGWRLAAKHADDSRWLLALVRSLREALAYPDPSIGRGMGTSVIEANARTAAAEARAAHAEQALREADKEATIAQDAVWDKRVHPCGRLHDDRDPLSAHSAIRRLHEITLAALSTDGGPSNRAAAYARQAAAARRAIAAMPAWLRETAVPPLPSCYECRTGNTVPGPKHAKDCGV